jgi:hypothetical protein
MTGAPTAFMSYAQDDDNDKYLSKFRELLCEEVKIQSGNNNFSIFQDKKSIEIGEKWKERIDRQLDTADFLVAIMTPRFFKSDNCRYEVQRFLDRERVEEHEKSLIVPIYYVTYKDFDVPQEHYDDPFLGALHSRQYADWREFRTKDSKNQRAKDRLAEVAKRIEEKIAEISAVNKGRSEGRKFTGAAPYSNVFDISRQRQEAVGAGRGGREPKVSAREIAHLPAMWSQLLNELTSVTFQSTEPLDPTILAARTITIRGLLDRDLPEPSIRPGDVFRALAGLRRALASATASHGGINNIQSDCQQAERFRKQLVQLLTDR